MRVSELTWFTTLAIATLTEGAATSPKRGLVFTPNVTTPQDNDIWAKGTDLTWYYNYQPNPSPQYSAYPQSSFMFVPMLWGYISDDSFFKQVNAQLQKGVNISHVLGFNEPDGGYNVGGSNLLPSKAAEAWVKNIVPLQEKGIKAGLPACTGGRQGIPWLKQFLGNCSEVLTSSTGGGETKTCTYDFATLHWYGNFEGMASHIGEYSAAFPDTKFWITEFNLERQDLAATQQYYNQTIAYLDSLDSIDRYSLFGAFRSGVSNVGPNAAFLNNDGKLTDIGSWYLGGKATGVLPTSGTSWGSSAGEKLTVSVGVVFVAIGSMLMLAW